MEVILFLVVGFFYIKGVVIFFLVFVVGFSGFVILGKVFFGFLNFFNRFSKFWEEGRIGYSSIFF